MLKEEILQLFIYRSSSKVASALRGERRYLNHLGLVFIMKEMLYFSISK